MSGSGLTLVSSSRERQVRLLRRQRERQLYEEYEAASEYLERVIERHAPGQVQRALDLYIETASRLQQYLLGTESHGYNGTGMKRQRDACHY